MTVHNICYIPAYSLRSFFTLVAACLRKSIRHRGCLLCLLFLCNGC